MGGNLPFGGEGRIRREIWRIDSAAADSATGGAFSERFLGTSNDGAPLSWQPKPGNYKVIALDDHGRSDSRAVSFASAEGVTLLGH
jgi:hypothetical protein